MNRPSLQFYPADWSGNAKLKRCSHAERGIWIDVLCLMHDSEEEYGVLRWPLDELANAAHCKPAELLALVSKGVLKGADLGTRCRPYVYTPRHAGENGDPVTLVPEQDGPVWYSSRMVRDEYLRTKRGKGTRLGDEPDLPKKSPPKAAPKVTPEVPPDNPPDVPPKAPPNRRNGEHIGGWSGDGASTSSSSSASKESKALSGKPDVTHPEEWNFKTPPPPGQECEYIIAFLNRVTGKRYTAAAPNLKLVKARLQEASIADIKRVIVSKADQWENDPEMERYLRPATLFDAVKFAQYVGELPRADA